MQASKQAHLSSKLHVFSMGTWKRAYASDSAHRTPDGGEQDVVV
jgi:hypothetical protein